MDDDIIEMGRKNKVLLRTICLPDIEPISGSSCFTSGINRDSKEVDAVQLNLFNQTYCDKHRKGFDQRLKSAWKSQVGTQTMTVFKMFLPEC